VSLAAPMPARVTRWDRATIVALGGAGCALSYDALQQMATAIHVRGLLTYLFPLVIDGFIAYGVRALVVLRDASFWSRLYVWILFGTATSASIWANALHAVRLNQQAGMDTGLRLGDGTVGILSTLAPLALAGAVHLYILIARRVAETSVPGHLGQPETSGHFSDRITAGRSESLGQSAKAAGQVSPGHQPTALPRTPGQDSHEEGPQPATRGQGVRTRANRNGSGQADGQLTAPSLSTVDTAVQAADQRGQSLRPNPVMRSHLTKPRSTEPEISPDTSSETSGSGGPETEPVTDELLLIARHAVTATGKATRAVVADAIRGQGLPLSNARLTELMQHLRNETGPPTRSKAV